MNILVTGAKGQLGRCLQDRASAYQFDFLAADAESLDITDFSALSACFKRFQPDLVINAAAYTAVDRAEKEAELAERVNVQGPKNLATLCHELDIPLIHISTDYVFDGLNSKPYLPDSPVSPQSVYGATKLAGERMVRDTISKHIIIRTSWVFSEHGNNFVKTMLRLASERDTLKVVADQYGCPTYAGDLADALLKIAKAIEEDANWSEFGLYHFCGEDATSWHGFARAIISTAVDMKMLSCMPRILPIPTAEFPTPAQRPEYSVLDCKTFPVSGVNRDWHKGLEAVLGSWSKEETE